MSVILARFLSLIVRFGSPSLFSYRFLPIPTSSVSCYVFLSRWESSLYLVIGWFGERVCGYARYAALSRSGSWRGG